MEFVHLDPNITLIHGDCMDYLATLPDGAYSLAVCDPQYGIGEDGSTNHTRGKLATAKRYEAKAWDDEPPPPEYFCHLKRVSKNQIIWGANHFISRMPYDSPAWIVWDKDNGETDFADCELAYTSFPSAVRKFKHRWQGMLQQNMKHKEQRIHPTQKPVALYRWLLQNYAKPGQTILDTHLGSGSSAIAAWEMGHPFTGIEIDRDYFEAAVDRIEKRMRQTIDRRLVETRPRAEQVELFGALAI